MQHASANHARGVLVAVAVVGALSCSEPNSDATTRPGDAAAIDSRGALDQSAPPSDGAAADVAVATTDALPATDGTPATDGAPGVDAAGTLDTSSQAPAAPAVLSVSPRSGDTGVATAAVIVVTFSKAMNKAKTELAYSSTDLPAANVAFAWNGDATVLTIDPRADLEAAVGTTLSTGAKRYSYGFAAGAESADGGKLAAVSFNFSTARLVTLTLPRIPVLDGDVDQNGKVEADPEHGGGDPNYINAGDFYSAPERGFSGFLAFDITALPAGLQTIESAQVFAYQSSTRGTPYAKLGALSIVHVVYDTLNLAALNAAPKRNLGVFSAAPTAEWKSADATAAVREDFAMRDVRGRRSQYRLDFPKRVSGDTENDYVSFVEGEAEVGGAPSYLKVLIRTP